MEKKRKISFIYIIHKPCSRSPVFMTTNVDIAQSHKDNGCVITCGGKVY